MIPDIAIMIAVYGAARLLVASLDPYRRGTGTTAQVAEALAWVFTGAAIITLAVLTIAVLSSSASLSNLTG